MKMVTIKLLTFALLVTLVPLQVNAGSGNTTLTSPEPTTVEAKEASVLINRLNEIKAMDMSGLKAAEKKQLRKEVKSIKSELKTLSGGVYLSVGAIIIILLVLILLL